MLAVHKEDLMKKGLKLNFFFFTKHNFGKRKVSYNFNVFMSAINL